MSLKTTVLNIYVDICRVFRRIKRNRVLFVSFGGKSYSDNPRAISEELHKLAPNLDIVWLFNNPESKKDIIPDYIKTVDADSNISYYREMATCAVMVNNFSFSKIRKGKNQLFVQTWHGDRAFKKVLYDSPFVAADYSISEAIPGFCDFAVAGSDYGERQYRSAFHYTGKVLKVGTPRDDVLIENSADKARKIKQIVGISENVCTLLYAPTLRRRNHNDGSVQQIQDIDIEKTLDCLEDKYGKKWVCLMRAHPAVSNLGGYTKSARIIDVAKYEDMADLLLIADMLITDYSSSAGDYALLKKPLVLFQSDIEEYLEKDRSFYFDMNDSPYYTAHNQNELETIIYGFTEEEVKQNCEDILKFYGTNETGNAAHAVAEIIVDYLRKQGALS